MNNLFTLQSYYVHDADAFIFDNRVDKCFNENSELRRKVENLEGTNK